ncbi:oligosaccharide flippase family protein [Candidatus Omnitrophota bacterium]
MNARRIINLIKSQLARHLTLVFAGNLLAAGLGFITVLMISRSLSVSDFGMFNLAISVIIIAPSLASLGMDTSMIKFASSYLGRNQTSEAAEVLRINFYARIIVGSVLAIIIFAGAGIFSKRVLNYPGLATLLKLTAFGVLATGIFNYLKSALYIHKLFNRYVLLQLLFDLSKLLIAGLLIFSRKLSVFYAVLIFSLVPLLAALPGFWQIRNKLAAKKVYVPGLLKQLLSYSKWAFINNVCSRLFPYISIFMLAKMLSSHAVGIYGLALNLTYIFPILIASLGSVLLPETSRFTEISQVEKYIQGSLKISLFLSLLVFPFLFFSRDIIAFFFGHRYLDSVIIFNWLLLSYIFATVSSPIRSALYSMNKPWVISIVDLLRVSAMAIGCYLLIPPFGLLAPAVLSLAINAIALGFFILYVFKLFKWQEPVFSAELPKP